MSLLTDASVCSNHVNLAKDKIKIKFLTEIEKDLETYEKISIIFLMTSPEYLIHAYEKITDLLERNKNGMIQEWIETSPKNDWEEKLLEALLIIKNIEVIKKLGFTKEEQVIFEQRFQVEKPLVSPHLNRVLKALYYLCNDLNNEQTKSLIDKFQTRDVQREELEVFLLFWIRKELISVSGILYLN